MLCAKCKTENPDGLKFCNECGAPFKTPCTSCGFENASTAKFCGQCGAALGGLVATASAKKADEAQIRLAGTSAPENLEGERKTITVLFADIKGSMELIEDLDPEEARAVVDPTLKLMTEAVHRYGGYVAQSTGDGIFALFGAPIAHEDHPQRALISALRMQAEVKRYAEKLRAEKGVNLQVRIGVHTGEVVVRTIRTDETHTEFAPIGHSIGLASRLQALAPIGSIAATDQVRKLSEGYFAFTSLGPSKVKGVTEPVNVYEVTGLGPLRTRLQRSAGRGYTKFVGRDREMGAMRRALDLAKQGQGQVVAVIGEPGVGKSRLVSEFKARVQSECLVLEAFSVSYGKALAWLPVIDLLNYYFRISDHDDPRTRREKVGGKVLMLERSLEDTLTPLLALLGIADTVSAELNDVPGFADGAAIGRRLAVLNMVKRLLLRESLNQPLVLIFEDLHWIDAESQALLDTLVESLGSARTLLLVNYRPEYRHEWSNKSYYTQVRLDPLGRESAQQMLAAQLGQSAELAPLKRLIIEKTEGNPFFMEEIVQRLFEDGVLIRNGESKLARPLSGIQIPATVQAILAARIDRLPPDQKDLLQTLAVIGNEFAVRVVSKVSCKTEVELSRMLADLQSAEFIYEQPSISDIEYAFKHALTQEVAQKSMLMERRKALHERAGAAIEMLFSDQLEEHYSKLAHHYSNSANRAKSFEYSRLAGKRALARYAYDEAIGHLRAALELLPPLPTEQRHDELEIQLALGQALVATKGRGDPETALAYSRARELCDATNAPLATKFEALEGVLGALFDQAEMGRMLRTGEELLALAESTGDAALIARARYRVGFTLVFDDPAKARSYLESALSSEAALPGSSRTVPLTNLALCLQRLGYLDRALTTVRQAEPAFTQGGMEPWYLAAGHGNLALFYATLGDGDSSLRHANASESVAEKYGLAAVGSSNLPIRAWALALLGRHDDVLALVRAFRGSDLSSSSRWRFRALYAMGQACVEVGLIEEGIRLVKGFDSIDERSGMLATVDSLKGRLLLRRNPPDLNAAESYLHRSIQRYRATNARFGELLSSTALARVLLDTGRRDEARSMLVEVYGWFTEGFDNRYLKEAKALLDELSA